MECSWVNFLLLFHAVCRSLSVQSFKHCCFYIFYSCGFALHIEPKKFSFTSCGELWDCDLDIVKAQDNVDDHWPITGVKGHLRYQTFVPLSISIYFAWTSWQIKTIWRWSSILLTGVFWIGISSHNDKHLLDRNVKLNIECLW